MAKAKENKGDNVMVIKLSEHKVPQFLEKVHKPFIYFGEKNDYPEYLLTLYDRSAKHNAIINQKSFYVFGGGSEVGEKTVVNTDGETLNEVMRKAILDYELFGAFALEIIWNMAGKGFEMRHINASHVRSDEKNSKFYYTKDWIKKWTDGDGNVETWPKENVESNKDWQVWDAFNPKKPRSKQLYYYKCYRPGVDTYALPEYIGAIPYIETDFEIANYWYNAVKNGFTASHIITFYGDPGTQEEQKKLEERIRKKFTGTDRAGKIILNFSANKEKGGSEIANIIPQDLDKQFNVLNETVQQEIFSGHRITSPMLFGIKTPGQLGGRTEMIEANELFQNIYVTPKQKIFNTVFTKLISYNGIKEPVELQKATPIGIDFVNSTNAWAMLTEEERRDKIGMPPYTAQQKAERKAEQERKDAQAQNGGQKFSDMKKLPVDIFKKYKGTPRKGTLIACRQMHWEYTLDLKASEHSFSKQNFAALRQKQLAVLDLLDKNPLEPPDRIAEAMGKAGINVSIEEVNNIITFLLKRDLLEVSKDKSGVGEEAITVRVLTPVKDAIKILEESPAPTENIFTVYSYELLPEFADWPIEQSRQDCQDLMEESAQRFAAGNLWTREEIELIQTESGLSPWESRGGWMTKKGTDIHLPHCHHIWVQHLYTIAA